MLWIIFLREVRECVAGFKFLSAMAMLTVIVPLSGYTQARHFNRIVVDYQTREDIHKAENSSRVTVVTRPIPPLFPLFNGVYDSLPDEIELRLDSASGTPSSEDLRPLDGTFPKPYLGFIVGVIMTLMAILLGHDAISGEREQGTLRLLFSYPIARSTLLMAKLLTVVCVMTIALIYSVAVFLLMIVAFSDGAFTFSAITLAEIMIFSAIALLLLILFSALGIATSTMVKQSSIAPAGPVALWVAAVLIWPSLGSYVGSSLFPIPPKQVIQQNMIQTEAKLIEAELAEHRTAATEIKALNLSREDAWHRFVKIKRRWTHRKKAAVGSLAEDRNEKLEARDTFVSALLSISPYGAFREALAAFCGTGLKDYYIFLDSVERYDREEFLPASFQHMAQERPWLDIAKDAHVFEPQPFITQTAPLNDRLIAATSYVGLLAFEIMVLVLFGLVRFRRYDPR